MINDTEENIDCKHEWRPIDSQFDNELQYMVVCVHCRIYGECCMTTGKVFWPAT